MVPLSITGYNRWWQCSFNRKLLSASKGTWMKGLNGCTWEKDVQGKLVSISVIRVIGVIRLSWKQILNRLYHPIKIPKGWHYCINKSASNILPNSEGVTLEIIAWLQYHLMPLLRSLDARFGSIKKAIVMPFLRDWNILVHFNTFTIHVIVFFLAIIWRSLRYHENTSTPIAIGAT
jgi:hypothetical protein